MRSYGSWVYDTEADGGISWRNVQLPLTILYFIMQALITPCLDSSQSSSIYLIGSQQSSQILVLGCLSALF